MSLSKLGAGLLAGSLGFGATTGSLCLSWGRLDTMVRRGVEIDGPDGEEEVLWWPPIYRSGGQCRCGLWSSGNLCLS